MLKSRDSSDPDRGGFRECFPPCSAKRTRRPPLAGRPSVQSLQFALGEGTFLTGSAVFFIQIVGLSAAEVGLGLTSDVLAEARASLAEPEEGPAVGPPSVIDTDDPVPDTTSPVR